MPLWPKEAEEHIWVALTEVLFPLDSEVARREGMANLKRGRKKKKKEAVSYCIPQTDLARFCLVKIFTFSNVLITLGEEEAFWTQCEHDIHAALTQQASFKPDTFEISVLKSENSSLPLPPQKMSINALILMIFLTSTETARNKKLTRISFHIRIQSLLLAPYAPSAILFYSKLSI